MDAGGSRGIKPKGEEPGSGLPSGRLFFRETITYKYFVFSLCVLLS